MMAPSGLKVSKPASPFSSLSLTGGALALVRMAADRQRRRRFGDLAALLYVWMIGIGSGRRGLVSLRSEPPDPMNPPRRRLTMPYGPAIFVGLYRGMDGTRVVVEVG